MLQSRYIIYLLSGGMDSAVAAVTTIENLIKLGADPRNHAHTALFVRYGQNTEEAELEAARRVQQWLVRTYKIPMLLHTANFFLPHLDCHAITESTPTPDQADFWYPMRNPIMLMMAAALIPTDRVGQIVIGARAEDGPKYPDCGVRCLGAVDNAINLARPEDAKTVFVAAPIHTLTKSEVVKKAAELKCESLLPLTHSCYISDPACGKCPSCTERAAAIGAVNCA